MLRILRQLFGLSSVKALPEVRSIEVARLKPTDVLVVEMRRAVSMKEVENIQAMLKPIFPDNKVVVCDDGTKLRVVSAEEAAEAAADAEGAEV
jgi:hypothetical protein